MTPRRFARWSPAVLLVVLTVAARPAAADVKWDPFRTTAPESLEELKALQGTVQAVSTKCTPFTVGIRIGDAYGSGVIVNAEGLVLTAGHVSGEPKRKCKIILPDGTEVEAKSLGQNKWMDSGMIQITGKAPDDGWPFAKIAKSKDLKTDQWVVALGHPNGVKKGRPPVARLGQLKEGPKDLKSWFVKRNNLRTSCTLVGGDSGGPLFDLQGRLIGIHSQIGLSINANLHVPLDEFKPDWDQLLAAEKVFRKLPVDLGVEFEDADDIKPATVSKVTAEGPGEEAGFKKGDVVRKFDGKSVSTLMELVDLMNTYKPGKEVDVVVRRGTRSETLTVTLGEP